jgi:hypothetical protein
MLALRAPLARWIICAERDGARSSAVMHHLPRGYVACPSAARARSACTPCPAPRLVHCWMEHRRGHRRDCGGGTGGQSGIARFWPRQRCGITVRVRLALAPVCGAARSGSGRGRRATGIAAHRRDVLRPSCVHRIRVRSLPRRPRETRRVVRRHHPHGSVDSGHAVARPHQARAWHRDGSRPCKRTAPKRRRASTCRSSCSAASS